MQSQRCPSNGWHQPLLRKHPIHQIERRKSLQIRRQRKQQQQGQPVVFGDLQPHRYPRRRANQCERRRRRQQRHAIFRLRRYLPQRSPTTVQQR
ncbi:hypothetical protein DMJ13_19535 [halophilic archaeon]|nr:hypothetical protein DMJ13_19535 [halophilic archaeon]